jgi:hypothetical protein
MVAVDGLPPPNPLHQRRYLVILRLNRDKLVLSLPLSLSRVAAVQAIPSIVLS